MHGYNEVTDIKCYNCIYYDDINMQPDCAECVDFNHFSPGRGVKVKINHAVTIEICDVCKSLETCHIYDTLDKDIILCNGCLIDFCAKDIKVSNNLIKISETTKKVTENMLRR